MIEEKYYDKSFYEEQQDGSFLSARRVLPLVKNAFHPKSVLDIGCGVGYWLKVWKEDLDTHDLLGIEGPYVTENIFQLDKGEFVGICMVIELSLLKETFLPL